MKKTSFFTAFEGVDIYVIDQILKGRYKTGALILDAGCGTGRNLHWFYLNNFKILGIDSNPEVIAKTKANYKNANATFQVAKLNALPFKDNSIDHIINCAVLHFSEHKNEFLNGFKELIRVLKPGGSLLIRTATSIGIELHITHKGKGVYELLDNTRRFLLTQDLLDQLIQDFPVTLHETPKFTNVNNLRCMATLVFVKNGELTM